jgi:hypothetical protein
VKSQGRLLAGKGAREREAERIERTVEGRHDAATVEINHWRNQEDRTILAEVARLGLDIGVKTWKNDREDALQTLRGLVGNAPYADTIERAYQSIGRALVRTGMVTGDPSFYISKPGAEATHPVAARLVEAHGLAVAPRAALVEADRLAKNAGL